MVLRCFAAMLLLCATIVPGVAQEQQIRIGLGFGLAFLPLYVCEDLKLIEQRAKAAHIEVKVEFPRLMGAAQAQAQIASGAIDIAPFGTAPLLAAWDKGRGTPQQIFAVSGLTSLPLVLLSNQADEQTIADLKPSDRIAMPTLTAPQMQLLEMASEKIFGRYDRLRGQVVAMSHADAVAAFGGGQAAAKSNDNVTAYFSSPPYTQFALRDANVHAILKSTEVMNGKFSFLVLGATKAGIERQPQMPEIVAGAIDAAARIIHDDPRRAAQIFLTHEPSGTLNGAAAAAVIGDIKDEFGSAVYGVQTMAEFLNRHGELKAPPKSWKDVVAPALLNSSSS
jgi:NitT/TauT family transport system substrate-binding protein